MFGRIYCGMHSLIDVYGGATLGTIISLPFSIYHDYLDTFFYLGGIEGPALASFCVFLILYYHPFFPGKCPCYEDTFSALSAGLGVVYGSFMLNIHHPIYSSEFPDVPFYLYRTVLGVFIVAGWKAISKPVIRKVFALGFDRLLKKFRLYKKKKYSALGNQKSASTLSSNSSKGLHVFSFDLDVGSGPDKIYSDNNMARIPIYILIGYISVYVMPWLFFYLGV
ncbi:Dihydrosphingosine 1-phosphate phosphatase [Zancudomyces culisetae]|uniref:Dihydrosphingosine 1-phosphate phosphatase n=1 Tax=Zancudomyces culisetae TaxID=1213189 RepID=A0A1R1PP34_ZANCU|nr:Dihydrosphingosine 1-phosphate phosphatase [Zancudomyces culisetae]|eukprot:OMH82718.1 Dihydrosphingosine 1-phosphate phosphatase [Zancudomyces culisetae]